MLEDTIHDMLRLYDAVPAFYHTGVVVYMVYVALRGSYSKADTKSI